MDISDEELRKKLANYMDNVPPVTASTREVLRATLAKFISSDAPVKGSAESETTTTTEKRTSKRQTIASTTKVASSKTSNSSDVEASATPLPQNPPETRRKTISVPPRPASPDKRQSAVQTSPLPEHSTDKSPVTPQNLRTPLPHSPLNKSRNGESILYEDGECRVRYFPSSEMPEYPGGVPVFRRRSLHPLNNREETSDPYEEFYIRSPRLQAKMDAERIISRVLSGSCTARNSTSYRNTNYQKEWIPSGGRKSLIKLPSPQAIMELLSCVFLGICALLLAPINLVRSAYSRIRSLVNWKVVLALLFVCILVALISFFIYSDPFYRNPVAEFADRLSSPLASFIKPEN